MKHLFPEHHHPHLRRRTILEFVGLFILGAITYTQWDLITEAVQIIGEINAGWLALILGIYWLILPLTAISLKHLTPKPKKLRLSTTILAHLAGAGPGRIIPGGIGNISISSIHLRKTGLSIEQAIGVMVTNNAIGLLTNILLVVVALIIRPETFEILSSHITSEQLLIAGGVVVFGASLWQWLSHARSTRKETTKTYKAWRGIVVKLLKKPRNLCVVVLIALTIVLMHTLILYFSAQSLGFTLIYFDAVIALSFGVAIGGILPTPGGVGGVEAGITAALVILGYDATEATSAAILFRIATYAQALIPGTLAYFYLRERKLL